LKNSKPKIVSAAAPERVVGLFAGIGGLEQGLSNAGYSTQLLCELDESAQRVLSHHFSGVPLVGDIRELRSIGKTDILCAGFPCQDLSQAGKTAGIDGSQSGTVQEVFRIIDNSSQPEWVIFENVPFMLHLARGNAMKVITGELESRGYNWAYRVINAQAFGLPQRRKRVLILASLSHDPRAALLSPESAYAETDDQPKAYGFYWTEGNTGIGWAIDAIPTLKGGSSFGIPSPPAIWIPQKGLFTPDIRDAERLQGFEADWTSMASPQGKVGARWKLVGNSVAVPMAEWVGHRLRSKNLYDAFADAPLGTMDPWPKAGWGSRGKRFGSRADEWPTATPAIPLLNFLKFPLKPLSIPASAGFQKRASASSLKLDPSFLRGVDRHIKEMRSR
jgi:DNA (cytosine-5)-methyltransferase 1